MTAPLTNTVNGADASRPSWRRLLVVAVLYYLSAQVGLRFATVQGLISPMWPPSGVAFTALFSGGLAFWPAIAVAETVVQLQADVPWMAAVVAALTATAGAALGAGLARRLAPHFPQPDWPQDFFALLFVAATSAALVSGALGAAVLVAWRVVPIEAWLTAVTTRVMGDWMGIGIVAPLALTWLRGPRDLATHRWREAVLLLVPLAGLSLLTFGVFYVTPTEGLSLRWALYPLVAWAAVRFGVLGASGSVFVIAVIASWATVHDRGPFGTEDPIPASWRLGGYLMATVATAYSIAFLLAARERGHRVVERRVVALESALRATTAALIQVDAKGLVLDMNPAAVRLLGWGRDAIVGHSVELLVALPSRDAFHAAFARAASDAAIEGTISANLVGAHQDGSVLPLRVTLVGFAAADARRVMLTLTTVEA